MKNLNRQELVKEICVTCYKIVNNCNDFSTQNSKLSKGFDEISFELDQLLIDLNQ